MAGDKESVCSQTYMNTQRRTQRSIDDERDTINDKGKGEDDIETFVDEVEIATIAVDKCLNIDGERYIYETNNDND